jgi:hypothetical protein
MPVRPETRRCPAEFQDRLTRLFGKNQFGDPHFKIVWGQSEFIRMGNVWRDKHGNEHRGYLLRYQVAGGQPCWTIMRWHAPFEYGSPAAYYANTYDSLSKLHIVGEYPWRGRYEVVQPLISKEFKDGKLIVTHFPISHFLIDTVIPLIEQFRRLSAHEQAAAHAAAKAAEEAEQTEFIADLLEETGPTWWGPVSYTRQGIKTSVLQRKMEQIQKVWDRWSRSGAPVFAKGISQGDKPSRLN